MQSRDRLIRDELRAALRDADGARAPVKWRKSRRNAAEKRTGDGGQSRRSCRRPDCFPADGPELDGRIIFVSFWMGIVSSEVYFELWEGVVRKEYWDDARVSK